MDIINTVGRRKTSVARVYLKPGKGDITINKKTLAQYFASPILRTIVNQPLVLCHEKEHYDLSINVRGGGNTGQAEAIRLAVSRALDKADAKHRPTLKSEGFLTRDPRMVERKKSGRRKARKRFQFSKR